MVLEATEAPVERPRYGRLRNIFRRNNVEEPFERVEGVILEHKLLQHFFRQKGVDVQPIATDSFLDKSRDEYNAAWLTRELVQNYVDNNPKEPGTLNGVRFTTQDLPNGKKRFRIEGDWVFTDPTGVISPHSEKPEDINTAGGNGIGLKQTAIRLLRDFGVDKFQIQGERWVIDYQLAKAAEINNTWANQPEDHKVKHDWLVANVKATNVAGKNAYIIETDNSEVIAAMQLLPTLGVSKENPYLQDMDYQNQAGGIKWLFPNSLGDQNEGRLFINGQVMNFKSKGTSANDYWKGPENVTVQLNNLKYKISIDRPPVTPYELELYLNDIISKMSKDDILGQLKRSEDLWAGAIDSQYGFDRLGSNIIVQKLVKQLPFRGYTKSEYNALFGDKNYLSVEATTTDAQVSELRKQGYIVCSAYFAEIGMPKASSKLSSIDVASNEAPSMDTAALEALAQEHGMEVGASVGFSPKLSLQENLQTTELLSQILAVEKPEGKDNTLRISLNTNIAKELLFHPLHSPINPDQWLVFVMRGLVRYGLENKMFKKVFSSQGEYVTTYGLRYDQVMKANSLVVRNIKNENDQGTFFEIELDEKYFQEFYDTFKGIKNDDVSEQKRFSEETSEVPTSSAQPAGSGQDQETESGEKPAPPAIPPTSLNQGEDLQRRSQPSTEQGQNMQVVDSREGLGPKTEAGVNDQFDSTPITLPDVSSNKNPRNAIEKEGKMSDGERERVEQMESELPGIVETIDTLDALVPERKIEDPNKSPVDKYIEWRQSDQFYGQLGDTAGYLSGRQLMELVDEYDQAQIDSAKTVRENPSPTDITITALKRKLENILKRMNPAEDDVDDFDIVLAPTERQLAQLGLLRMYTLIATNVALPNDLFLYKGTGSKGVNIGQKAIGLHESLLEVRFTEALRTFTHEIAHNYPEAGDHGVNFRHAMESLFASMIDRISEAATRLESGEHASPDERVLLDVQKEWNKLIPVQ